LDVSQGRTALPNCCGLRQSSGRWKSSCADQSSLCHEGRLVSSACPCRRKTRASGTDRQGSETKSSGGTDKPLFGFCKAKAMEVCSAFYTELDAVLTPVSNL